MAGRAPDGLLSVMVREQRGQTSAEYMGVLLLVAVIVGALVASGIGTKIADHAGNGGQELRTWLLMAAALGFTPGKALAYSPMPEWLTGMGVALIEPDSSREEMTS